MPRRAKRVCACLVALLALVLINSAASADTAALTLLSATETQTLTFDARNQFGRVAELTLALQLPKDTSGALLARLFPTGPEAQSAVIALGAGAHQPYPTSEPVFFTEGSAPPRLSPGVNLLRLRFGVSAEADPEAANGFLKLGVKGSGLTPLFVETKGQGPRVSFVPSTAKLQVTRGLDLGLVNIGASGDSESIQITGPGTEALTKQNSAQGQLNSAGRGQATATLTFPQGTNSDGTATAEVKVSGWSRPGSYSGDVVIDPRSVSPSKQSVEVNVRDSFIIPLLLVTAGALLGFFGRDRWAIRRRRRILQLALKDAYEHYTAAVKPDELYRLDDLWGSAQPFPTGTSCKDAEENLAPLPALYCAIQQAMDEAAFKDVTTRTQAVLDDFAQWYTLRRALLLLTQARQLANPPAASRLAKDVDAAIRLCHAKPPADQAAKLEAMLARLRELLLAYARLAERFGEQGGHDGRFSAYDPNGLYEGLRPKDEDKFDASAVWKIIVVFDTALDLLKDPDSAPEVPPGRPDATATQAAGPDHVALSRSLRTLDAMAEPPTIELKIAAPRIDQRSAHQIIAGVRRVDWLIGLSTALITILAYVLTLYTDTYGGLQAYATAFAAGFLGQAIAGFGVALASLPPFQSYRPASSRS